MRITKHTFAGGPLSTESQTGLNLVYVWQIKPAHWLLDTLHCVSWRARLLDVGTVSPGPVEPSLLI